MKILFFSTSSNHFDGSKAKSKTIPAWSEQWQKTALSNPEHEIIIATQFPGMFLLDINENEIASKAENITYKTIEEDDEDKIADFLASLEPDIAVAATSYVAPFDWLTIKDGIIAEKLRERGIKSICHPSATGLECFDKWRTHQKLEKIGINCAKAVYIHHELFINGGNRREIKSNVYRTCVLNEISRLKFPVIIKDTTGLSSFGMDVVNSFEEARNILFSKKTSSDRIVEELIAGEQFGCEIVRNAATKDTKVLEPFLFSVNRYGITSPKQSVKAGPINDLQKYNYKKLSEMLKKTADGFELDGIAQIDLVFDGNEWFVIEINPRLSGMSTTYSAWENRFLSDRLMELALKNEVSENGDCSKKRTGRFSLNIKFPLLSSTKLQEISSVSFVDFVNQLENLGARQLREMGYCEVIISADSKENLRKNLFELNERFKGEMEEIFLENAVKLIDRL